MGCRELGEGSLENVTDNNKCILNVSENKTHFNAATKSSTAHLLTENF